MLFNSLFFLFIFFPIVTGGYYLLPHKFRWVWLLLASCYFYMGFIPQYILVLGVAITIDYFAGIFIAKSAAKKKKYFLILSIVSNLGLLFIFKYFNFFNANLSALAALIHWNYSLASLSLVLPIGLSFHTFQSLSYIIEVYRGRQTVEKNFGIFALYVMFYPQLLAGPIERPQNLLPQFRAKHEFKVEKFFSGLRLILWGLFKKVVIADQIALIVNPIFGHIHDYTGAYFILATFLFAFQIYCDFSGYSDMARGLARTIGFELMVNFRAPYFASSIFDFWHRWHISLSTWFRDYVYIPLGGNRVSSFRLQYNIFLVFLLSGLWHGANWTYLVWGILNGGYLIISGLTIKIRSNILVFLRLKDTIFHKVCSTIITFLLIDIAWIFFRAKSLPEVGYIFKQIFINGLDIASLKSFIYQYHYTFLIIFGAIGLLTLVDYFVADTKRFDKLRQTPLKIQIPAFIFILFLIMLLGRFVNKEFLYFQF